MAKKYNSQQLLQLLTICSWKNKSELSFSGFSSLSKSINNENEKSDLRTTLPEITQQYLNTLLSELTEKVKTGEHISRSPAFIKAMLKYVHFTDWNGFEKSIIQITHYMDIAKWNTANQSFLKTTILAANSFKDTLTEFLIYPEKITASKIATTYYEDSSSILPQLKQLKQDNSFIIWIINDETESEITNENEVKAIREFIETKNVIPIRVSNKNNLPELPSTLLNQKNITANQAGLLLTISCFEMIVTEKGLDQLDKPLIRGKITIENLNNTGTINTGDVNQENHGGNNAGGNIIQNFYTKPNE